MRGRQDKREIEGRGKKKGGRGEVRKRDRRKKG